MADLVGAGIVGVDRQSAVWMSLCPHTLPSRGLRYPLLGRGLRYPHPTGDILHTPQTRHYPPPSDSLRRGRGEKTAL